MATGLGYSASDYLTAMKELLPKGPAWELDDNSFFIKLLETAAKEFARIDADILNLIKESDPRTCTVTFTEWLDEWGIPDACLKDQEIDLNQYRQLLVSKIATQGYTFAEFAKLIGLALGYADIQVGNFDKFVVSTRVDQRIYGANWKNYFITVSVSDSEARYFTTQSFANEDLATWGNNLFECLIKAMAPAYCGIIFKYIGVKQ